MSTHDFLGALLHFLLACTKHTEDLTRRSLWRIETSTTTLHDLDSNDKKKDIHIYIDILHVVGAIEIQAVCVPKNFHSRYHYSLHRVADIEISRRAGLRSIRGSYQANSSINYIEKKGI